MMLRVILGVKIQDQINMKKVREKIQMMSVNQMNIYHIILESYNIMRNSASEQIKTKWTNFSEHDYLLRSETNKDLKVPDKPSPKCLGFSYFGTKLFNMLPRYVREDENPSNFKKMTKEWIWKNIPSN